MNATHPTPPAANQAQGTRAKCSKCKKVIRWQRSPRTGQYISRGGWVYGDCACDLTTWKFSATEVVRVSHAAVSR